MRHSSAVALSMLFVLLSSPGRSWGQPVFEIVPVSATGDHSIVDTDLIRIEPSTRVVLEVFVRDWSTVDGTCDTSGNPCSTNQDCDVFAGETCDGGPEQLKTVQMALKLDFVGGGILFPPVVACAMDSDCVAAFGTSGAVCDVSGGGFCLPLFQDAGHSDSFNQGLNVDRSNMRAGFRTSEDLLSDGTSKYLATIVLESSGTEGTVTIGLTGIAEGTFLNYQDRTRATTINLIDATIDVTADCVFRSLPITLPLYAIPGSGPGGYVPRNRYLAFIAPPMPIGATTMAIRVRITNMPMPSRPECAGLPDASGIVGDTMWVNTSEVASGLTPPIGVYGLTNSPLFQDWTDSTIVAPTCVGTTGTSVAENKFIGQVSEAACLAAGGSSQSVIMVSDCNILPCGEYEVSVIPDPCSLVEPESFSDVVTIPTVLPPTGSAWCDATGPFDSIITQRYPGPDGITDLIDVASSIAVFKSTAKQPPRTFVDLTGEPPLRQPDQGKNHSDDLRDIAMFVACFKGFPYSEPPPTGRATACN